MENLVAIFVVVIATAIALLPIGIEIRIIAGALVIATIMTKIPDPILLFGSVIVALFMLLVFPLASVVIVVALVLSCLTKPLLSWGQTKITAKLAK